MMKKKKRFIFLVVLNLASCVLILNAQDISSLQDNTSIGSSFDFPEIVSKAKKSLSGTSLSALEQKLASAEQKNDFRAKGLGTKLLEVVALEGGKVRNHTVISRITEGNGSSIHIHEKLGYTHVGVMKEVGFKFGKFLDVNMMQYVYGQEKK